MTAAVDHLAALYAPSADSLRRQLPDIADGVHGVMMTLYVDTSEHAAELAAMRADAVRRHCLQLADALRREARQ